MSIDKSKSIADLTEEEAKAMAARYMIALEAIKSVCPGSYGATIAAKALGEMDE